MVLELRATDNLNTVLSSWHWCSRCQKLLRWRQFLRDRRHVCPSVCPHIHPLPMPIASFHSFVHTQTKADPVSLRLCCRYFRYDNLEIGWMMLWQNSSCTLRNIMSCFIRPCERRPCWTAGPSLLILNETESIMTSPSIICLLSGVVYMSLSSATSWVILMTCIISPVFWVDPGKTSKRRHPGGSWSDVEPPQLASVSVISFFHHPKPVNIDSLVNPNHNCPVHLHYCSLPVKIRVHFIITCQQDLEILELFHFA